MEDKNCSTCLNYYECTYGEEGFPCSNFNLWKSKEAYKNILNILRDGMNTTFRDKRKREWEMFIDRSYYDMTCIRPVGITDFNSGLAFHFDTWKIAEQFAELIKVSS